MLRQETVLFVALFAAAKGNVRGQPGHRIRKLDGAWVALRGGWLGDVDGRLWVCRNIHLDDSVPIVHDVEVEVCEQHQPL